MKKTQGFTLIELLVVIGILSILAVALLLAINPAEAQRKARDTQRLKDMANLQAAMEGYITDHPGTTLTLAANSLMGGGTLRGCGTDGWLSKPGIPMDVCNYLNKLPLDPRNTANGRYADSETSDVAGILQYAVNIKSNDYHICTRLESKANFSKTEQDGYTAAPAYYDVYSSTTVECP